MAVNNTSNNSVGRNLTNLNSLAGLVLEDARARVGAPVRVVTTEPTFTPRFRQPVWGEWRVLRARQAGLEVELLVAREMLGEVQLAEPPSTGRRQKKFKKRETSREMSSVPLRENGPRKTLDSPA